MRRRFTYKYKIDIHNEILYTSSDSNIITPYSTIAFGANIISNTYLDGKGIIKFDGNVTNIGNYAFKVCTGLTSITIPESVTSIGYSAFEGCSSLTSITIPDSVVMIRGRAFTDCFSLISFYGKFASIDNRCLINSGELVAFAPGGLTEYTIPNSVASIGIHAFLNCTSLTSITLPNSITTIGERAFFSCTSLTSVTIGNSVTTIGLSAFQFCTSLTSVYCKPTTPPALLNNAVFLNNGSGRKIYVPYQSLNTYKIAQYWSEYADDIVEYDFENDTVVGG